MCYVCIMRKQIPARVTDTTIEALKQEAAANGKGFSKHVDEVLTKHVSKQNVKPTPKRETNG